MRYPIVTFFFPSKVVYKYCTLLSLLIMHSLCIIQLCCLVGILAFGDDAVYRRKRQAFFAISNNAPVSPVFFQFNNQLQDMASQIDAARCQALAGQAPPVGCTYVPVVRDST